MEKVIQVPSKKVKGWMLPEMPGECPPERAGEGRLVLGLGRKTDSLQPLNPLLRFDHRHLAVPG